MKSESQPSIVAHRFERFGGILSFEHPAMLVHVDKDMMRSLGLGASPLWDREDDNRLSFPLETHLAVTGRCDQGCSYCYMDSVEDARGDMSGEEIRGIIDMLARRGVFSIAMGGGEALLRPDLFALARHARSRSVIPNLTTSGRHVTPAMAREMTVFGQVNVSIDAVGVAYGETRRAGSFDAVDRAITMLLDAGVATGINTVVHRGNFDALDRVVAYAERRGLVDVELLRYKPAGRARREYLQRRLTPEQADEFFPHVLGIIKEHAVAVKVDCSFVPMICAHEPDPALLETFSVYGCEGANVLLGIAPTGRVNGCSFFSDGTLHARDLEAEWDSHPQLERFRAWPRSAPEPCASCAYLAHCKGGCHAVAVFLIGQFDAPDPECPAVRRHREAAKKSDHRATQSPAHAAPRRGEAAEKSTAPADCPADLEERALPAYPNAAGTS